ncbi:tRNA lysidine(34) synthetase TilS [Arachidicoccus terrestris]|uniref:tRNA lysidine(34) synthetase TilS n=1 Tax=Arachidicoccus terrestris TaxID=2875539 RepID=UPI001CC7EDC5|nr:tRNA lysidine(34) synthetase TilS [Arachidicoccus terrestris]UAY54734.1 tRNA lysidine(34) synthetase TilS [Arachidicoccus terrestris]
MAHLQQQKGTQDLFQAFKKQLEICFPYVLNGFAGNRHNQTQWSRRPVLLAISGGMDSMVLGRLLFDMGIPAIWVHCNFHLRGEESDRDASFVRSQAALIKTPLIVKDFHAGNQATEWKMSIEETARKLRYDFFKALIAKDKVAWEGIDLPDPAPEFLMTAHHANDQIETLLLNFFRGCGISGLHGIPAKNGNILRPLLAFKRSSLFNYARSAGIDWVEDSTNQSTDYTRNYLRNKILPELKTIYPVIEDTLLDNLQRFSQAEVLYQAGLEKYKKRLLNFQDGHLYLSVRLLQKSGIALTLLWEALRPYGFGYRQLPEVEKLLSSESGAYQDNAAKDYRILRNRAHLVLSPLNEKIAGIILIEKGVQAIEFPAGRLELSVQQGVPSKILTDPTVAMIDSRKISFPLLLRKWKPGDYFYPLGMLKKKKVARFLIDQKVGMHEKGQIWVLLESGGRIIWVVGHRLDERFKITQGTKNILKLKLLPTNDCPK